MKEFKHEDFVIGPTIDNPSEDGSFWGSFMGWPFKYESKKQYEEMTERLQRTIDNAIANSPFLAKKD